MVNEPKETKAWRAYRKYRDGFLSTSNCIATMNECRRFYSGDQYDDNIDPSLPKPVMNICNEYVEKVKAKLTDTPYAVEFTTDAENTQLHLLDQFYDYQKAKMKDDDFNASIVESALIDGVGCAFTMYDKDTYGLRGKYRGFLRRKKVNFEDVFFANPYCEEPQDQKYLGFVQRVSVQEARNLCEDESKAELIVPDDYNWTKDDKYNPENIDFDTCTLVTRYFRDKDGEVVFEQSTQYCDLFKKPHYIRPDKNDFDTETEEGKEDYSDMEEERITIQEKAETETDESYRKKLKVFHRYPFSWYRPYPVRNTVLGRSMLTQIISNQKQVNFMMMMIMLGFQYHGMGKWVVQEGALADGETITNDPSQVIHVKAKYNQAVGSVLQRIEPSTTSNEQLNEPNAIMTMARQIYGYDNLTSDNNLNDTSGYALQQVAKQQNLVLEIPQQRYWAYIRSNAETDLLFFRDYVDEAKFFQRRDQGEIASQNAYKDLSQNILDANGANRQLSPVKEMMSKTIKNEDFMSDFEIAVTVTQGIGQSEISESQHYSQVFQWISTGNMDASLAKAWVDADPAFSKKTRDTLKGELEAYENSQIQALNAQIDQYKNVIEQLKQKYTEMGQQVTYQQAQLKAYKQASEENARNSKEYMNSVLSSNSTNGQMSDGEAKSNASRGIEGSQYGDYSEENDEMTL